MPSRGSNYYYLVEGPTWEKAQDNAVALGGHLTTISHPHETEFLVSAFYDDNEKRTLINNSSRQSVWIGYRYSSNSWNWISGETVDIDGNLVGSYTNWGSGEGTANGENYAEFLLVDSYNRDPGQWNDNSNPPDNFNVYGIAEVPMSYFSIS